VTSMGFSLGEQFPEGTVGVWIRHAVIDAPRSDWARAICPAGPLVWVHEIAGAPIPFPGPLGDKDPNACRECSQKVRDWPRKQT
jgi:hypothetical protein